jgi:hypothetical protein
LLYSFHLRVPFAILTDQHPFIERQDQLAPQKSSLCEILDLPVVVMNPFGQLLRLALFSLLQILKFLLGLACLNIVVLIDDGRDSSDEANHPRQSLLMLD